MGRSTTLSKFNFTIRHRTCLLLMLVFCANMVKAQTLQWNAIIAGSANGQMPSIGDIKPDHEGNLVVTAAYSYTNTLNGETLPVPKNYTRGVDFLAKFDPSGRVQWMDTSHFFGFGNIEISKKGDYFFSGYGPDTGGNFYGTTPTPKRAYDFIAKCDRNGKMYWIRKYMDYNNNDESEGIVNFKVDTEENVYVMGALPIYPDYFEIDSVKYHTVSKIYNGSFVAKFDSSGNLVWIKKLYGDNAISGKLDIDSAGDVYCIASDSEYSSIQTSTLFKFDKNGNLVKKITIDTINSNAGINLVYTDGRNGLYIVGQLIDTTRFLGQDNTGKTYAYFARLDSNLKPKWILYEDGGVVLGQWTLIKAQEIGT